MRNDQLVKLMDYMNRRFAREKTPTIKDLRKTAHEMSLKRGVRLPKGELLRQVNEKLEYVRKEARNLIEVEGPKQALQKMMTTWNINPIIQTNVETFMGKMTTNWKGSSMG